MDVHGADSAWDSYPLNDGDSLVISGEMYLSVSQWLLTTVLLFIQHTSELISIEKLSREHDNKDLRGLR